MILKFFLGVAIVAFTSFCGYFLSKKYRLRNSFFAELWEFNERFLSEISYYRRPLGEFLATSPHKGSFGTFLESFYGALQNEERERIDLTEYDFLTKEEKSFVEDYFSMLGRGDSGAQKTFFSSMKEPLSKIKFDTQTANKKYGDLYIKLGFLCGLLILILIL